MDPVLIFIALAILLPLGLCCTIILPLYISMWVSLYLIYKPQEAILKQVHHMKYQPMQIWDAYMAAFDYWLNDPDSEITLPLILPLAVGVLTSLILSYYYTRWVRNIFRISD